MNNMGEKPLVEISNNVSNIAGAQSNDAQANRRADEGQQQEVAPRPTANRAGSEGVDRQGVLTAPSLSPDTFVAVATDNRVDEAADTNEAPSFGRNAEAADAAEERAPVAAPAEPAQAEVQQVEAQNREAVQSVDVQRASQAFEAAQAFEQAEAQERGQAAVDREV